MGKVEEGSKVKMPPGLCADAQRLWKDTRERWETDDQSALIHLSNACFALTRLRRLEGILAKEGSLVRNRFGQQVRNPVHVVAMAESRNFRECMRSLALDIESVYTADEGGD